VSGPLRVLDLFSGIGGFSLGLERTGGFKTVAFCEIEEFPRRVLAKHWPDVPIHRDVRELKAADVGAVDVICGGFPCQDISVAGEGRGLEGERSGLWREYARLIGEIRPEYVIVENVAALCGRGLSDVLGDLAALGYDAEWHCIPASYLGAWHRRDRIWILSYPDSHIGCEGRAQEPILRQSHLSVESPRVAEGWPGRSNLPAPTLCRAGDGLPNRVARLAGLGNAVVPQVTELIGRAILEAEGLTAFSSSKAPAVRSEAEPVSAPSAGGVIVAGTVPEQREVQAMITGRNQRTLTSDDTRRR
jgi:DNA (cytosine-5)-methyltransferase 1